VLGEVPAVDHEDRRMPVGRPSVREPAGGNAVDRSSMRAAAVVKKASKPF
jgi:hypothetical protein